MGMGMSISPQIWQQFVDLVFQDNLIKRKQNFDVIMDDTFIHSMKEEHMDDLMDLFKVIQKYGLKILPHKCQFFKRKIVYMGLEFQIKESKVCCTPLKDKCKAIRNLESPKTLKQTRAFCGMVIFLSSFLPNLQCLLIPIYDLQKKSKKFKWTQEDETAFKQIKELLISQPVVRAPTPEGLFQLESDTSCEGVRGTLFQKQGDEWVVIGYRTDMTIRQKFFIHNLMNKVKRYIKECHTCLKTKPKYKKNRPLYGRILIDYAPMQDLSIDIKHIPMVFGGY